MNSSFNEQILTEKLRRLNNTQQSIETLSHWCIFHRKKAQLIVDTWDKQLKQLPREQYIPFLYLANDILQNSKRHGEEFVTEFWKVLPEALRNVLENSDEKTHKVVLRLVDIWDDRKVFGQREGTLREELLGNAPADDLLVNHSKSNDTIKLKVPAGSIQESLATAYQCVHAASIEEHTTLGRCNSAIRHIQGLAKEAGAIGSLDERKNTKILAEELQQQQKVLIHCMDQLDMNEQARVDLVSKLKEALQEQEMKLKLIREHVKMAKTQFQSSKVLHEQLTGTTNSETRKLTNRSNEINDQNLNPVAMDVNKGKAEQEISSMEKSTEPVNATPSATAKVAVKLSSAAQDKKRRIDGETDMAGTNESSSPQQFLASQSQASNFHIPPSPPVWPSNLGSLANTETGIVQPNTPRLPLQPPLPPMPPPAQPPPPPSPASTMYMFGNHQGAYPAGVRMHGPLPMPRNGLPRP